MTLCTSHLCMIRVDTYTVSHIHDIFVVTFSSSSSLTAEKENLRKFCIHQMYMYTFQGLSLILMDINFGHL